MEFKAAVARILLFVSLSLIGSVLASAPGRAAADLYVVSGIEVDVTAQSAVLARERAIRQAQREGLRRLLHRLTREEDWGRLPDPETLAIESFVRSFAVEEEKRSATRYLGKLLVRYDPEAVRELLARIGVAALLRPSDPVLVVPVLMRDGAADFWGEENPWRRAWLAEAERNTVVTILLPLGDLADIRALAGSGAEPGPRAIDDLTARYGSRAVIFAAARPESTQVDRPAAPGADQAVAAAAVRVQLAPYGSWPGESHEFALSAEPGEEVEAFWRRAVRAAIERLDADWKAHALLRVGIRETVRLRVPLAGLRDWVQIRKDLEGLAEIGAVRIDRLTRREGRLSLEAVGGREPLARRLRGLGYEIKSENGGWLLRRAEDGGVRSLPSSGSASAP